jgi:hypothetical protein
MNQAGQQKSFVPNFENDIFISYTHIDNAPLAEGQQGWISFFHTALNNRLRQLLGAELEIWRDVRLQGIDYLSDAIPQQLPKIAVLVSILSPRYLQSEWCLRELQEFVQVAEKTGGLRIANSPRLCKVIKTPIPRHEQPPELKDLLGYDFFEEDPQSGKFREFRPELGKEAEQKFFNKLEDVVQEVAKLLRIIKAQREGGSAVSSATNGPAVYLAPTTSDLSEAYDKIRRELLERNCRVLPSGDLPLHDTAALKNRVLADLGLCKFSVHLIGAKYGFVPEDETHSLIEIQHELASEFSRNDGLSRLIWLPPGLQTPDERQQKFIHALRTGAYVQARADLLETPLEELKSSILAKLRNGKTNGATTTVSTGPARIYLICCEQDRETVAPLEDYLYAQGFEVELPAFEGDETQLREAHQDKLMLCEAALIYGGAITDAWLGSKKADLQKVFGWGRQQPLKAAAIYLAGPETVFKQRFRSHEINVLKNFAAFAPDDLRAFVAALRK